EARGRPQPRNSDRSGAAREPRQARRGARHPTPTGSTHVNALRFAFALALGAATAAGAQDYPSKPIKFIAPLAAASAVDAAARVVAAKMSENMGQQIVVENIPGAAGLIGA